MTEDLVPECCPKCGAGLEKTRVGENGFIDDCPNCSYRFQF